MRPVFILSIILLLVGCKQRDERVLMVDEQGSFAIGGTVLVDSLGHTYHGDHAYVFYQKPVGARKYPLVFAHGVGQFSKTWETTPDGREGFQKRDKETLDQYFRQMTPTIGTTDFEVYSDAYAALFDKIGPGVFITHSQGGPVGWNTLLKTRNIKAIASYEPGGAVPFPEGQLPEEAKFITLSKKMEGIEVPMSVFMEYTKVPIVIYYGDNLPETDERPELYEWTRRLYLMKIWAKMLNDLGGDVTVIHLPEVGLHGNTHFPMSDLNNIEVADLLSEWLHTKALD